MVDANLRKAAIREGMEATRSGGAESDAIPAALRFFGRGSGGTQHLEPLALMELIYGGVGKGLRLFEVGFEGLRRRDGISIEIFVSLSVQLPPPLPLLLLLLLLLRLLLLLLRRRRPLLLLLLLLLTTTTKYHGGGVIQNHTPK